MKKSTQAQVENPTSQATRVARLLRRIQPWLQTPKGRMPTFAELHEWTGIPENTLRGWFAGEGNPTAEFLLRLLERVPGNVRSGILEEFLRVYPTLEHPRLSGDRAMTSRLRTLLGQSRACTYIQGGSEETRTLLINALAHSFLGFTHPVRRVLGVDVHACDWFIPVPGVLYLDNALQRDEFRHAVELVWQQATNGHPTLVMFNGLSSSLPDLQDRIRSLANRCHVLVADDMKFEVSQLARASEVRTTLLTLGAGVPSTNNIAVEIRAA